MTISSEMTIPPTAPPDEAALAPAECGGLDWLTRDLIELLPAAVYVCDASAAIVDYNRGAAELWGRAPRLRGKAVKYCGFHRLYLPDGTHLPHDMSPMAHALNTGLRVIDTKVIGERSCGSRLTVLVSAMPMRDKQGNIAGVVSCLRDITDQVRLAKLSDQSEQLESMGQLAGSAAHEFGNLLAAITLNLNLIERRMGDAVAARHVQRVRQALYRGEALIEQLLALAPRQSIDLAPTEPGSRGAASGGDGSGRNGWQNGRKTVLLVDNDPDLRAVAVDALSSLGCEVMHADGWREAVEVVRRCPVDLLLVDCGTDGMGDLEVIKQARAIRPNLELLMLVGRIEPPGLAAACRLGATVLRKPFRAADFEERIRRITLGTTRAKRGPFEVISR
jgi:PAS domain S-box-containing protein